MENVERRSTVPAGDALQAAANRLIILGGRPRSGATLVQNMLDSHPEVLGGPEFLHLVDIIKLRNACSVACKHSHGD